MRVYRWRKPEIIVTKGTGGTFTPGTYYVWGYYLYGHFTSYGGSYRSYASSPRPDVVQVEIAEGESLNCSFITRGNITSISDAGDGKININCEEHCLTNGDTITITGTTSYNGTYTITDWVDYDNFLITATYVASEIGEWSTTTKHNSSNAICIYMLNQQPFNSNGDYVVSAGGNRMRFSTTLQSLNITAYTSTNGNYTNYAADCDILSLDARHIIEYGLPYITGTEVTITDTELNNEFINAGVGHLNEARTDYWYINMHIRFANLERTITNGRVKFLGHVTLPKCMFSRCWVDKIGYKFGDSYNYSIAGHWNFQIENCLLEGTRNSASVSASLIPSGINNTITGMWTSNMEFKGTATNSNWGVTDGLGSTRTIENLTIVNGAISCAGFDNVIPCFRNLTFLTPFIYDIRIDNNTSVRPESTWINVNTARENNEIICSTSFDFRASHNFWFYREKEIFIYDENGVPINGVNIKIIQGSNEYTCTTNEIGKGITPTMLEQTQFGIPNTVNYDSTIYFNWVLEVSKTGYETYKASFNIAKDIEEQITLKPISKIRKTVDGQMFLAIKPELGSEAKMLKL